jgi:hypothetical protein
MNEKPKGFEDALGEHETLYWDSTCKEPIMWGWKIVKKLDEDMFTRLKSEAEVECIGVGASPGSSPVWVVVSHHLTSEEAIEKYGAVLKVENGPRGGWKSTTYSSGKTFTSRYMSPLALQQLKR